jgi:hypothetical protein
MRTKASLLAFVLLISVATAARLQTVYKTKTGDKYHAFGCRYLKKSCIAISIEDAKKEGLSACSRCSP